MLDLYEELSKPLSIVGNAESIFQNSYGELIDQNDTIRFNRTEIINTKSQGAKWDYLVSSEINTFEQYNNQNPKFHSLIFSPTQRKFNYKVKKAKFKTRLCILPLFQSEELQRIMDAPPSTGLQILYYLDYIKNKQVNIFGFDFKKTPTFYETRNKGKHNWIVEKDFILKLVEKNNWQFY